jgi:hypothetical protein
VSLIDKYEAQVQVLKAQIQLYTAQAAAVFRSVLRASIGGKPLMPMSLDEAIRIRNELIVSGGWCSLMHQGIELTPRQYTRFDYNDEMYYLKPAEALRFLCTSALTVSGMGVFVMSVPVEDEPSMYMPFRQPCAAISGQHLDVDGTISFGFN